MIRTEYKMKAFQKVFYALLGVIALVGAGFLAYQFASEKNAAIFMLIALFVAFLGVYLIALAARTRLVLEGSRLELRGAFREKAVDLGEIEGYRVVSTRNGSFSLLYLKEGRGRLSVSHYFATDDAYREWFQQIANLDDRDRDAMLAEIAQDESLGATQEDRVATLTRARQIGYGLAGASIIAAIGINVAGFGQPIYWAAALVLVALAVAALAWTRPQLYAVFKSKSDPRAELGTAWMIAGFGFLISSFGSHLVSYGQILPAIATVFVLVLLAFLPPVFKRANRQQGIIGGIIFGLLFSYGFSLTVNQLGDKSEPSNYVATVRGKHISSGKSKTDYLELAPWGPFPDGNSMSVSSQTYAEYDLGDQICLGVYAGTLHASWYGPVTCAGLQQQIQDLIPKDTK